MTQPIDEESIRYYCLNHPLSRPQLSITKIVLSCVIAECMVVLMALALHLWVGCHFLLCFETLNILLLITFGKKICKTAVMMYQRYASASIRRQCSCQPSCSEYAILALDKFSLPIAIYKIWHRVNHTCKEPGYHYDYP